MSKLKQLFLIGLICFAIAGCAEQRAFEREVAADKAHDAVAYDYGAGKKP